MNTHVTIKIQVVTWSSVAVSMLLYNIHSCLKIGTVQLVTFQAVACRLMNQLYFFLSTFDVPFNKSVTCCNFHKELHVCMNIDQYQETFRAKHVAHFLVNHAEIQLSSVSALMDCLCRNPPGELTSLLKVYFVKFLLLVEWLFSYFKMFSNFNTVYLKQ